METTQKQGYLTETNSTHLHKDALALIFLMEALREEIYKSLGVPTMINLGTFGGNEKFSQNTNQNQLTMLNILWSACIVNNEVSWS